VIVGNKINLERSVRTQVIRAFAEAHGIRWMRTSALICENILILFEECAIVVHAESSLRAGSESETITRHGESDNEKEGPHMKKCRWARAAGVAGRRAVCEAKPKEDEWEA